ncbi:MAG: efflux RND transporter periplasmic adaptor subunit [Bacillota bacterium]|nr:efflux RND transporter periplasmic adaptor subunit [Bacillota bacterium]
MWPKKNLKMSFAMVIIAVCEAVFLTGCSLLPKEKKVLAPPLIQPKKQEYQVYEVTRGDITRSINSVGSIISTSEADAFVKENGRRIKNVSVKLGSMVKKGDLLIELDSENTESDLTLEKFILQKVELSYEKTMQSGDDYAKKMAEIDLNMEKYKVQQMEQRIAAARITAPISGKVINVTALKEGDAVEAYKALATVADPDSLKIVYNATGNTDTKTGMKVELTYSGKVYEGVVEQIPDSGKYKDHIIISPNTKIDGAKLGDSIDINIIIQSKKDTLIIPKSLIKSFSTVKSVEVLDGDKKYSAVIETGIETTTEVEILSGLKEGQKLILR